MIIATAGHVDHGKTTLLQAITGVNADRLPEEKKRGMTIDLGYAYWPQPDGRVLGFIDVPGHEKFLSNMLAGVGGIDHALLVVACDDGVMAQTREHLAILQLTGNPQLTVALTKADRVDDARVSEVRETVQATCGSMALPMHRFLSPWRQKGAVSTNFATICSTFHHALTPAITAFVWRSTGPLP
jgi:selenocysteine-specific elongation factor